jgi:ORF6N domain
MASTEVEIKGSSDVSPAAGSKILLLRGLQAMLDTDLAEPYGVETRVLLQQVKRNPDRFPDDFMFRLSEQDVDALRSQIVISNSVSMMSTLPPSSRRCES